MGRFGTVYHKVSNFCRSSLEVPSTSYQTTLLPLARSSRLVTLHPATIVTPVRSNINDKLFDDYQNLSFPTIFWVNNSLRNVATSWQGVWRVTSIVRKRWKRFYESLYPQKKKSNSDHDSVIMQIFRFIWNLDIGDCKAFENNRLISNDVCDHL